MKTLKNKKQTAGEFLRFATVGVIATILHYGIYLLAMRWMPINVAYTLGYVLSFIANFYLTSWFTFHAAPTWGRLAGMVGAHAVNYLMHIALLNLFIWLGVKPQWAPIPVYCIVVPINFLLVRFVFKHKR